MYKDKYSNFYNHRGFFVHRFWVFFNAAATQPSISILIILFLKVIQLSQ